MRNRGFTLVELMIVVAIVAILAALAAPSFKQIVQSGQISSGVNTFLADARYARSEATRLGGNVVMCRSDAPEAATPACGAGSGPGGNGWVSGWVIFHDLNANGAIDAGERLLRIQSPVSSIDSIVESGTPVNKIRFTATGRLRNLSSGATTLQFGGNGMFSNEMQRVVCVSLGGRARIAGDGTATCP